MIDMFSGVRKALKIVAIILVCFGILAVAHYTNPERVLCIVLGLVAGVLIRAIREN